MSNSSWRNADGGAQARHNNEAVAIRLFLDSIQRGDFVVLWFDPKEGGICAAHGRSRAAAVTQTPVEVDDFAVYQLLGGEWHDSVVGGNASYEEFFNAAVKEGESLLDGKLRRVS